MNMASHKQTIVTRRNLMTWSISGNVEMKRRVFYTRKNCYSLPRLPVFTIWSSVYHFRQCRCKMIQSISINAVMITGLLIPGKIIVIYLGEPCQMCVVLYQITIKWYCLFQTFKNKSRVFFTWKNYYNLLRSKWSNVCSFIPGNLIVIYHNHLYLQFGQMFVILYKMTVWER